MYSICDCFWLIFFVLIGIQFSKINIEEQKQLAELYDVHSIPYLLVFKNGVVIYANAGNIPESHLKDLAQQALEIEFDTVKEV